MIYCVSDIHGDLDKLERMMELIRFSDADHLYIIGDVIDRGVMGVDILRWIMVAPNMTMLLGNHEQMCLDTLGPKNEFGARDLLASLLHALEEYKRGLRENVSCLDCLRGELYGSINACQRNRSITRQEAEYLREKYL